MLPPMYYCQEKCIQNIPYQRFVEHISTERMEKSPQNLLAGYEWGNSYVFQLLDGHQDKKHISFLSDNALLRFCLRAFASETRSFPGIIVISMTCVNANGSPDRGSFAIWSPPSFSTALLSSIFLVGPSSFLSSRVQGCSLLFQLGGYLAFKGIGKSAHIWHKVAKHCWLGRSEYLKQHVAAYSEKHSNKEIATSLLLFFNTNDLDQVVW